jgi:cytochrome P450
MLSSTIARGYTISSQFIFFCYLQCNFLACNNTCLICFRDVCRFVRDLMKVVPVNALPVLRFVPGLRSRYLELCNTHDRMMKFLNDALDDSLRATEGSDPEVSFASTYRDEENTNYDRTELLYILRDLIVAGTETSVTSIRWALIELANRPELQVRFEWHSSSTRFLHLHLEKYMLQCKTTFQISMLWWKLS